MERVAPFPPNDLHERMPKQPEPSASARQAKAQDSRFRANAQHGALLLRNDGVSPKESRDDPTSQRWNHHQHHTVSYERLYDRRYQERPRYDPRHQQMHRQWHHQPDPRWYRRPYPHHVTPFSTGGMVPVSSREGHAVPQASVSSVSTLLTAASSSQVRIKPRSVPPFTARPPRDHPRSSVVIVPKNIIIPRELSSSPADSMESSPTEHSLKAKRSSDSSEGSASSSRLSKKAKLPDHPPTRHLSANFDKLDLLCAATLDLGPLQDNPTGCSCPKSKCIALYCDCFKAGRRCDPSTCTCINCKNTLEESGPNGARSKAIQSILSRNPRAFTNAGNAPAQKLPPGEACNCIRSRCLKLYCTCFQVGKACNPTLCSCVGCLNTEEDQGGHRALAIEATLDKRPDAFEKQKPKEVGSGCACKNNKCIRKYCECFRTKLACSRKCSCRDCENPEGTKENYDSSSSSRKIKKIAV